MAEQDVLQPEPPSTVAAVTAPTTYDRPKAVQDAVNRALSTLRLPNTFISPGDKVVLKPNWIKEHDERTPGPDNWTHVITHPSVIEAVTRWVATRLEGSGTIVICDAPQTDSSFAKIRQYCQLDRLLERCQSDFPGTHIELLDLRPEEWHALDGVTVAKTSLPGDPAGNTRVDLGASSEFEGYSGCGNLYGASYDMRETNRHHTGGKHEYLLSRTPMDADVFINLPKLKTHKKVGITCALKNLVGINANKNWLPHHTEGTPDIGGDQFPSSTLKAHLEHVWMGAIKARLRNRPGLSRLFVPLKKAGRVAFGDTQRVVRSGNWYGNDTCWRMVLDLNKCLWWFDGEAARRETPRRYLSVVDGIIGGEGNGPAAPDPKPCGLVLAGTHPVAVDVVAASIMGFAWDKLPLLRNAFHLSGLDFVPFAPDDVTVLSDNFDWDGRLDEITGTLGFRPHFGWIGAIERPDERIVSK
jgi:uncharacterized protein (DUF362 family)